MPQALGVFAVCLPIYVWAGSFARDAAWMSASFAIFAINWGAFYFAVQQLKRPELQETGARTRVHVLCGLLWSAAVWQMAAFADHAGAPRETLLLLTVGAAVICLFFTAPSLPAAAGHRADRHGRAADRAALAAAEPTASAQTAWAAFALASMLCADPQPQPAPPVRRWPPSANSWRASAPPRWRRPSGWPAPSRR